MKKTGLFIVFFMVAFAAAYLACCYLVPGWRIKLAADSFTYFLESIKHMAFLKSMISLGVGLIAGAIPVVSCRMKIKQQ